MSRTWYPMINYALCSECGTCINKCSHGVYDLAKAPRPLVVYTEGCVQGCHGCANLCLTGAIDYLGESTDQTTSATCCCSCE